MSKETPASELDALLNKNREQLREKEKFSPGLLLKRAVDIFEGAAFKDQIADLVVIHSLLPDSHKGKVLLGQILQVNAAGVRQIVTLAETLTIGTDAAATE